MGSDLQPWGWHALGTHWDLQVGWIVVGVVVLAAYLLGVRAAARRGTPIHPARVACFVFAILLLEITLASAINAYAMSIFWVHMIEHLTLIMVVPAFLVLGHPLTVAAEALPGPDRELFLSVLHSRPVAALTHPLTGLGVYAIVIVGTHLTSFMDTMAMHSWLMTAEQVLYVFSGWLLLLPLIGNEPIRWKTPYLVRIMLLLVAMVPDTVVGIVLLQSDDNPFPMMMGMHPSWAPAPISDLHIGGGLMWAVGDGLMMCFAVGVVVALISNEGRRAQLLGPWLEGVRRQTLVDHVSAGATQGVATDIDPDGDDALAAYNRMLGRLEDEE